MQGVVDPVFVITILWALVLGFYVGTHLTATSDEPKCYKEHVVPTDSMPIIEHEEPCKK